MTLFPSMLTREFRSIDKLTITDRNTIVSGVTNTEPILLHALCNAKLEGILTQLHFEKVDYYHIHMSTMNIDPSYS